MLMCSVVATWEGGVGRSCHPNLPPLAPLEFPNQTRPKSFSFKHQGYCFLWLLRNYKDQKFPDFYSVC